VGLSVIILAAGKGNRMRSGVPKVLHSLAGTPLLERVVNTAQHLQPDAVYVVYGNGGTVVRNEMTYLQVNWVEQETALGTGHAVLQAIEQVADDDQVLILAGDVPLISANTLQSLLANSPHNALGLVVSEFTNPFGLGRIIRNEMGNIIAIVEQKDADEEQQKITEINTSIMTASAQHLKQWLPKLGNKNAQKEYYLTDVVAMAVADGFSVGGVMARCPEEVSGVNNLAELSNLERYYQRQLALELMLSGTTIMDPQRFDVRGALQVGADVSFDVNVVIEGQVTIGDGCSIGANVLLRDVTIAAGVTIKANSIIENAVIEKDATIGPFARLRPGAHIGEHASVGNFVEVKNTTLGVGSKANHLSYLGDAHIGAEVNVGAGVITCNYDGVDKHQTTIEDGASIGSNVALVAPITVGKDATIGAGSAIAEDAPAAQLTLARPRQTTVTDWVSPKKRQKKQAEKTD